VWSFAVVTFLLSTAALIFAILAIVPFVRQWWWNEHASWPYDATARWLQSPIKTANLRIALILTNLSTRSARFQVYVQVGDEPEVPLSIQLLDGDPLQATSHIHVGPRDRERFKITLTRSGEMETRTCVILLEGAHPDHSIPVGPPFVPPKGPEGWILRYRVWKLNKSRPIENLDDWGAD